jgi:NADP-dependent 3-hydroxy acid dehydrogenase YdfG
MSEREIAVLTGASSGIGAATARLLAKNGYHVVAAARRVDRLEALAKEDVNIEAITLDVTVQADVDALAKHLAGKPVSILINCAGGAFDADPIHESDPEIWKKTFDINVVGSVRMIKAITPLMQAFGRGHIVMISSTAGHRAYENGGSYVATKHAETSMVETLRLELNGQPIRVTEIAPGMVKTDEFAFQRFQGDKEKAAKVYEGVTRPLVAEDVAEAIRWSVMLPSHFNVDCLMIRPVAQAQVHKVYRQPL